MLEVDDAVVFDVKDNQAWIRLNAPESRNRLTIPVMTAIRLYLDWAAADQNIRVIVLTSSGNTFCSGADLRAAIGSEDSFATTGARELAATIKLLLSIQKPTIARVQGHTAAGGNGLIAACDLAVATSDSRFAFTEVRLGLLPAVIAVACRRVMSSRDMRELFLTGEAVSAERALRARLLTHVTSAAALDDAVAELVNMITRGGPEASIGIKSMLRQLETLDLNDQFHWAIEESSSRFRSAEGQEGMRAFLERRCPAWVSTSEE